MPITTSAKKAFRRDKRRTIVNRRIKNKMKLAIKAAKTSGGKKLISRSYSAIDQAAKKNLIHKNKAARLKSQISKQAKAKKSPSKSNKPSSPKPKTTPKKKT